MFTQVEALLCMRKTQPFLESVPATASPVERRKRHNTADSTRAANGQPAGRRGRKPRRPEPTSAAQEARQTRVFNLHVEGLSAREIAQSLGIDRGTAQMDVLMEARRRAFELGDKRDAEIAMSVTRYEKVIFRATQRLAEIEARHSSQSAASAAAEARQWEQLILEAQARIDLVLGLVAP